MGRPRRTPEQRVGAIPEPLRSRLLYAHGAHDSARRELEQRRQALGELLSEALTIATVRDVAELLGESRSTLHGLAQASSKARRPRA